LQAHKINFGTGHKHKFYVYAHKDRFMFTCINIKKFGIAPLTTIAWFKCYILSVREKFKVEH
jgi:hypothetical protein